MSTIRPVAPAPVVARSVRVSDKPVPKAVSPKLPLAAQAQMDRERPKFKTPEDYKNYVIKFAGYKRVAQQDVQAAQTELEQVQALMQTAEADYRRPLEAARADLDYARTLYQGPVDQAKHDRDEATTALDLALYPGKPHAAQLEAEAARTAEAVKDLEGKLAAGQDRLGKLDGLAADARARQQTAAATQADAKEQIKRLEESFKSNASIEEKRAALQSALEAARRDLDAAKADLSRLQAQDQDRQADLDRRARELAGGQAELEGRLSDAQARQAVVVGQIANETGRRDQAASTARSEGDAADRLRQQASPDRVASQQARVTRARQDAEAANQAMATAQRTEERRGTLQGQIERLTAASSEYQAAVSSRSSLKGQVTQKKQALDAATAASAALDPQRARVREAQARLDDARQAVTRAQADVRQYEQLDAAVKALTELKGTYAEASRAAEAARSTVADRKAALDQASAGSAEVSSQQQRVAEARRKLDAAKATTQKVQADVQRLQTVDAAISALQGLKSEYDGADNSRSAYKGQVTRKKNALNDAMASGDGAKITSAKAAYDEEVSRYNDADARCKAIGSRMGQYGATPDSLSSVISAKQSEHASLSGAPGALSSAQSAQQAAQSELDGEQRKLDGMAGVASRITAAKAAYDDAVRTLSDAQGRQRSVASQMSSYGASPDSLDGVISTKQSQRSALSGAAGALSSAQSQQAGAQGSLDREKAALAQAEGGTAAALAAAKSAYDDEVGRYNAADQRVRDVASRISGDGASPDNLDAEISRRRSELAGLPANGVEAARSRYQAARDGLDREEAELRRLQGLAAELADHQGRANAAANQRNDADRQLTVLAGELARLKADEPSLRASLDARRREADQARGAAAAERTRQAAPDHLQHERERVANAQAPFDKAQTDADQISALWDALQGQKARLADATKTIADAKAAEQGFVAEKAQLGKDLPTWTGDRDKKTADRQRMLAQAKQERETQAPASNPQVTAARTRLDAAATRLTTAQGTYDREVGALQTKLDEAQRAYDGKVAALKQRADAAGPALEAARKEVADVDNEFNQLPRAVSGWTRTWWKLMYHFDVDQFWQEQGPKLRDQMAAR